MKTQPKRSIPRASWLRVFGRDRPSFGCSRQLCLLRFKAKANNE